MESTDINLKVEEGTEFGEDVSQTIYNISSFPMDINLNQLSEMVKRKVIIIPNYQRSYVWSISQASLLIDSFLTGLPIPPVFLFQQDNGKSLIIDGQQRIISIVQYIDGFFGGSDKNDKKRIFKLQLSGESSNSPWAGKSFTELDTSLQNKLLFQTTIRAINIKQEYPVIGGSERSSAYEIFNRINTSGTPLRPQEVRNALYSGVFNSKLKQLNEDPNWRLVLGTKSFDKHQRDVEFLLRIFALYADRKGYKKPLKFFLNDMMERHLMADSDEVKSFLQIFPKVCEDVVSAFGNAPFKLRGPLNVAALDSVMSTLALHFSDYSTDDLSRNWEKLKAVDEFTQWTTVNTTDKITVDNRCDLVFKYLILGEEK